MTTAAKNTLILGGVRSGKSRLAENLAKQSGLKVTYIATASAGDTEMAARIQAHQRRRPVGWHLYEEPIELGLAITQSSLTGVCVLVDCLTLWLNNLLGHADSDLFARQRLHFLTALEGLPGPLILVSNETNMGVVPNSALARRYCDEAGALHQQLASLCERVIVTVAGLPQVLKGTL